MTEAQGKPTVEGVKAKSITDEFASVPDAFIQERIDEVSAKLQDRRALTLWITAVEWAVAHAIKAQMIAEGGGGGKKPQPPGALSSVTVGSVSKSYAVGKQPDIPAQYKWLFSPAPTIYGEEAYDIIRRWPPSFASGGSDLTALDLL